MNHHIEHIADQGRKDADIRHQMVIGLSLRKESKDKQTEQRAIGVASQDINGINQRSGVQLTEHEDKQHEETTHDDMSLFPKRLVMRLLSDIHAETGCQGGESGVGTRERGCHDTDGEEDR